MNTGHDVSNIQFDLQVMIMMIMMIIMMRMRMRRQIMMVICPVLLSLFPRWGMEGQEHSTTVLGTGEPELTLK